MSKRLFISQPMNGLSDEQVLQERAAVIGKAKAVFGDDAVPLETFFEDFGPDAKPLDYLARSIEFLAKADVAVFARAGSTHAAAALSGSAPRNTVFR